MNRLVPVCFFLTTSSLFAEADSITWKQYAQVGLVSEITQDADSSISGGIGYYRLNRQTENTFRDLRLFAFGLKEDSFIYLRYKSSDKYVTRPQFYRYTITSYRKNTRTNVSLQYHFNQGFGMFLKQYKKGMINTELGHAFDMSDYLNETKKTSYLKTGIFWDHTFGQFSTLKFEWEYFNQISEVVGDDLSRIQFMIEYSFQIKPGLTLNVINEFEDYIDKSLTDASSITFSFGWEGNLKWTI